MPLCHLSILLFFLTPGLHPTTLTGDLHLKGRTEQFIQHAPVQKTQRLGPCLAELNTDLQRPLLRRR
jgi:hypothetical protein